MKADPYWSVIIPVYNESKRIDRLTDVLTYLSKIKKSWELIIVDDGSTDDTKDKLRSMNKKELFRLVTYPKNQGKGYAVKEGMLAATGEHRLFLDIDLSTPITQMAKIESLVDKYPVVIGTRKAKGANVIVHQPWLREHLGKVFTFLSQLILGVWISDFTCGFKCFSKKATLEVFSHARIYRWGFDSEILFLAHKYGFAIKEVPVTWTDDRRTRVRFPQDLINSLSELLRIRLHDFSGLYRQSQYNQN